MSNNEVPTSNSSIITSTTTPSVEPSTTDASVSTVEINNLATSIIIDTSGSMSINYENKTRLEWVQDAILNIKNYMPEVLIELSTLDDEYSLLMDFTKALNITTLNLGEASGGTIFSSSIDKAGQRLVALKNVANRHILMITDGEPGDTPSEYEPFANAYYEHFDITLSVIAIDCQGSYYEDIEHLTSLACGNCYSCTSNEISSKIQIDLTTFSNN